MLFAGTPAFALASLRALVDAGIVPLAVLTQPDRPSGRGRRHSASPVKEYALGIGVPVLQPATLKDRGVRAELAAFEADVLVVAAYGLILPQPVLDLPRRGCLNVHASLLPRWRGAAPIQAAILAGDAQSGISLMQMEAGLDTGPVYASAALDIGRTETAGELHDRLAQLGGELLLAHLADILAGRLAAAPQDDALATYAGKIETADAVLDWQRPAGDLERRVRAYNPVPGARFFLDGELVKCWRATAIGTAGGAGDSEPGDVVAAGRDGVDVACSEGVLRLTEVQRAGRRRISGGELAAQQPLQGRRLGSA